MTSYKYEMIVSCSYLVNWHKWAQGF